MRRPLVITLSVLAALAAAIAVWAYWTAPGGGTASAASGSLAAATIGLSAADFNSVTVSWSEQASLVPASPASSAITYSVERKLGGGSWVALVAGGCSGTKPHGTASCADAVPVSGSYSYRVVASYYGWTATSNEPAPVSVTVDTAAPANAITLTGITGDAVKDADTVYYRGTAAGSFTLTNAVSDSGASGPASSRTAALAGTATGWSHTPSTVSSPAGGPYVSNAFAWSASTTSSPSERVTGSDAAGNTTATELTFSADDAGPTGGMVDATGLGGTGARYSSTTALSIAFSAGGDAGAGMATSTRRLRRSTATLTSGGTANGSCGSFGTAVQVGADDPVSPVADAPTGQACHRYEYVVSDRLGNSTTYTSPDIKIDTSAPVAPGLAFSAMTNVHRNASTLYYRSAATSGAFTVTAAATDANSGIDGYAFPTLPAGWTRSTGADASTYSWNAAGATEPSGAQNVTATNHAALPSPATGFTVVRDNTAPATGNVAYTNRYYGSLSVAVTFDRGSDAGGSGVDATSGVLQRTAATLLAGGGCGTYGTPTSVGGTSPTSPYTDTTVVSGKCYQYRYLASDNVGNQVTYTSTNVAKVDTAAPTITRAVAAKADGSTPGTIRQGGGYYIYAQVTDNASVSSVTHNASSFDSDTASGQTTGSWTIGALAYNYRSALLTANTPLTTGASYGYTISATDAATNSAGPTAFSVTMQTYDNAITTTPGLVSYWRFDDSDGTVTDDSFTDTAGTTLAAHTGATGASWTALASQTSSAVITPTGRLRKGNAAGFSQYHTSGVPASANYLVEADVYVASLVTDDAVGLVGRLDVSTGTTYFLARYLVQTSAWQILRVSGGVGTQVGTQYVQTLTAGSTYRLGLQMSGSTITLTVNGVARVTGTDATITATGRAGVRSGLVGGAALTDTTGLHIDNYRVASLTAGITAADSKGTNHGTYTNGPLLDQPGALVGDSDRAAKLDGTNDYVSVPDAASLDLGDGAVTLEAWVKRNNTVAISAMVFFDRGTSAIELAWEATDTVLVKSGVAYVGRWASTVSDTSWHHIVATRTSTSAKLYVDGTLVSGTNTPATMLNTTTPLYLGAQTGTSSFLGATIDEFAYYNTELTGATIQDHYRAGRGTG